MKNSGSYFFNARTERGYGRYLQSDDPDRRFMIENHDEKKNAFPYLREAERIYRYNPGFCLPGRCSIHVFTATKSSIALRKTVYCIITDCWKRPMPENRIPMKSKRMDSRH